MLEHMHDRYKYIYQINDVLEAYNLAYYLSKGEKLDISLHHRDNTYEFGVTKQNRGGSDAILFTIRYHINMKRDNIEVYYLNFNVAIKINEAGDLNDFIVFNKQRAEKSRFGIQGAVVFLNGLERLQQFLAAVDKYF
ncbi:hypothetical protein D3C81_1601300 [compost metagenome]